MNDDPIYRWRDTAQRRADGQAYASVTWPGGELTCANCLRPIPTAAQVLFAQTKRGPEYICQDDARIWESMRLLDEDRGR